MQVLSDLKKAKLMGLNTGWPYLQGSPASAPMFEPYHHMSVWTRTKDSHGVSQATPLFCLLTLPLFEMIRWSAQLTSQSWAGLGTKFFMFPKNPCLIPLFKFFFFFYLIVQPWWEFSLLIHNCKGCEASHMGGGGRSNWDDPRICGQKGGGD